MAVCEEIGHRQYENGKAAVTGRSGQAWPRLPRRFHIEDQASAATAAGICIGTRKLLARR